MRSFLFLEEEARDHEVSSIISSLREESRRAGMAGDTQSGYVFSFEPKEREDGEE